MTETRATFIVDPELIRKLKYVYLVESIFALAFILVNPDFVRIHWMTHRWQRVDEIGKLMMNYGNLMVRKNRLNASEQEIYHEISDVYSEFRDYIASKHHYYEC